MDRIEVKAQLTADATGAVEGIAWPFGAGPDRLGDEIAQGAFNVMAMPLPMLDAHDPGQPVGVWDAIAETGEGLTVRGRLLVDDVQRAREVRALIRAGAVKGLSIGYRTTKATPRKGGGRTILGLDLYEVSPVAIPAHPSARITSAKAAAAATQESDMDTDDQNGAAPDIAAFEERLVAVEAKADTSKIADRLDRLEARVQRPHAEAKASEDERAEIERKAFGAYLRLGSAAPADELKALNVSSDPQGGYLAPAEMAAEIIRELIEFSPIRSVASVRTTGAPSVIYPTRGDITNAKWHGEMATREESEISFGQREIAVKEISTFVDISNRLLADAPQAEAEVRAALAEDFGQKEATAFVHGDGVLQPEGFMNTAGIEHTVNGHAANLAADKLIELLYAMPAAYRLRGAWAMNGTTLAKIRQIKDGQSNYLWQPSYQAGGNLRRINEGFNIFSGGPAAKRGRS